MIQPQIKKKEQNSYLSDLSKIIYTEISFNEDFILPLKFDLSNITEKDVSLAGFNTLKFSDNKKREKLLKEVDKTKHPKKINIINNEIIYDFTELKLKQDDIKETALLYIKYIDVEDDIEDIYGYLLNRGFDISHLDKLQTICSIWIEYLIRMAMDKITILLELKDKNGIYYNSNMLELQIAYEHLKIPYFQENINKAISEWSYREKVLSRSYFTKKYMIDKAVDDKMKNEINKKKK